MFERFTERARQVVVLAQKNARELRQDSIAIPHIWLGLIEEEEGLAAKVLRERGYEYKTEFSAQPAGDKDSTSTEQLPFTQSAKKCLENALREALSMGHNYIGTEHILFSLLKTEWAADEVDARDAKWIRDEVIHQLAGPARAKLREERREAEAKSRKVKARGHDFVLLDDSEDLLALAAQGLSMVEGAIKRVRAAASGESNEERLRHIIFDALRALDAEAEVKDDVAYAAAARAILRSGVADPES